MGYGTLLCLAWFVYLSVITVLWKSPAGRTDLGIIFTLAAFMLLTSYVFAGQVIVTSRRQVIAVSVAWVLLVALVQLGFAIWNETVAIAFGVWQSYIIHLAVLCGPILRRWFG